MSSGTFICECGEIHHDIRNHVCKNQSQDMPRKKRKKVPDTQSKTDEDFEAGQKAERKRILEKFGKALRKANWDTKHSCDIFGTETLNKIEEELKKEVLK